jgi:hypothetical protein
MLKCAGMRGRAGADPLLLLVFPFLPVLISSIPSHLLLPSVVRMCSIPSHLLLPSVVRMRSNHASECWHGLGACAQCWRLLGWGGGCRGWWCVGEIGGICTSGVWRARCGGNSVGVGTGYRRRCTLFVVLWRRSRS